MNNLNIIELQSLQSAGIKAAKVAGEYIIKIYNQHLESDIKYFNKSKNQPLTIADTGSHIKILLTIKDILKYNKKLCNIPILSEESTNIDKQKALKSKVFWLIDPLDGTKEFINKNGEFAILLSVIENNKPVVGIIYFPLKNIIYTSIKENPAYKITGYYIDKNNIGRHQKIEKLTIKNTPEEIKLLISRSNKEKEIIKYIESLKKQGFNITEHEYGAAVKFEKLLNNKGNLYTRIIKNGAGPKQWDLAAGHCIIKSAGGEVLNYNTRKELNYGGSNVNLQSFIIKHPDLNI